MRIRLPIAILVAALTVAAVLLLLLRHPSKERPVPPAVETLMPVPADTTRVEPPAPVPAAVPAVSDSLAAVAPAVTESLAVVAVEPAAAVPVAEAPVVPTPPVKESEAPIDTTRFTLPLFPERAESLATAAEPIPRGAGPASSGELLVPLRGRDLYGLLAAWEAAPGDTAVVRPLRFWTTLDPDRDALLYRLHRRAAARHHLREELGLRPAFFTASDSLNAVLDARSDSLEAAGGAPGVYYRFAPSGGLRFLPPPMRWLSRSEPLKRRTAVDPDRARLRRALLRQSLEVSAWPDESYGTYLTRLTRAQMRSVWKEEISRSMKAATVKGGRAGLVRVSLPFEMPKAMRSIFGEGKPNLSVSGSERITFGGKSQWFPYQQSVEFTRKPSKFPQLEMDQDLTIRLKGTVGDKLDVDVDQSSAATTSLANRIQIHYKGYEDEIMRKIDLGNTSLRLPGTEYVSYGGQHTGLFGINAESQLGDLTLNLIVSKEEGETAEKSTSARSQQQTKRINDFEYVKDRFFFLDDPTRPAYATPDSGYVVQIDPQSVRVYLDDGDGNTTEIFGTWQGRAVLDLDRPRPGSGAVTAPADTLNDLYYFEQLDVDTDYSVLIDDQRNQTHPILILNRYLDPNSTIGVTYYDKLRRRWVGTPPGSGTAEDTLFVKMIRPRYNLVEDDMDTGAWGPTNRLMLKSIYPLQQSLENWTGEGLPENSILEDGFELAIHYLGRIGTVEDPDEIDSVRIVRHVGLDYRQTTSTGQILGQDGQVDPGWIDFQNGYLFFPDLQPFAPGNDLQTDLRGRPGDPSTWDVLPRERWNDGIYRMRSCVRDRDLPSSGKPWVSRYYLEVRYRTPVTELRIDAFDIIEGSEVVTAGNRRLVRDRDYRIDYQTGEIQLQSEAGIGADEELRVTYKHAGGIGMASKTLLGAAAAYRPPDSDLSLSTSWLFKQTGSPDRRPRLGSEPTRIAVGEVAGRYGRESQGLTKLLDRLPFLEARKTSKLSLEGGMGVSFPNPNTRKDLYIDDFEGVADDITVRLNRLAWKPTNAPAGVPGGDAVARSARDGEIWWYTPYRAAREGDLNPTLDYQEANDYRSVLELQAWPYNGPLEPEGTENCPPEESWVGIVTPLSTNNMDLTRARFLDIWVNDFVPWEEYSSDTTKRAGLLYLELGRFSEDAIWQRRRIECTGQILGGPQSAPNGSLDKEDANNDNQLDLGEGTGEDTGLDRVAGVDPADGGYDDFAYDANSETSYDSDEDLCRVYRGVNGTENNGRLDTEDLDGNNSLDPFNDYFRFRVDLADSSLIATDVRRDYADQATSWTLSPNNGWRRIRIPLSGAFLDAAVGDPSWDKITQLRLWLTGLSHRKRLQIGAIEIRSNRWVAGSLQDSLGTAVSPEDLLATGEDFYPGVVNNKENSDVYSAPFAEHRDQSRNNIREREQSLTLELRNLQPGHVGRVYSSFLHDQDYTGYEALEFYLGSTLLPGSDLEFFLRLGKDANSDSTDYYEYRVAVPEKATGEARSSGWQLVRIQLKDLSDLKAVAGADTLGASRTLSDGARVKLKGRPYLTNLRRITLGVVHAGGAPIATGSVWIDELRLADVRQDVDVGYRFQLRTELADLGSLDFSYKHVGADFTTISGAGFRSRRESESSVALNTSSVPLDRFLPEQLGLRLPFSYQYSRTRKVPKYRTNDDLLVGDRPTDRDVTETVSRGYSLSLSHPRSTNPWMRYTLDAVGLSGSIRANSSATPYGRDSTVARTFTLSYVFPFGDFGDVVLYKGWKLHLVPTKFSLGLSRGEQEQTRYRREAGDLNRPFILDYERTLRSGGLTLATGLRPIKEVTYDFSQSRNLMLRERASGLGGLNIGRETSRQEELRADYQLRLRRGWVEPRLSWKGTFRGSFNQQGTVSGGGLDYYADVDNAQTSNASMELPLARLLSAIGSLGGGGDAAKKAEDAAEPKEGGETPPAPEGQEKDERPPESSVGETRPRAGNPLEGLLHVGRTSGTLSLSRRSTFNRVSGEPRLEYQLGLSQDPGVRPLENYRASRGSGRQLGIDADFQVLRKISISARIQDDTSESRATGALTGEKTRLMPELDIRWGDLTQSLGVRRYLRTFKANTRFSRRERSRTMGGALMNREVTSQWSPFLDLDLTLKSGASASLRVDRGSTHTEDLSSLARITDRSTMRISLSAKRTLSITREVKVPLRKTKERVTTKLDLTLTAKYDTDRSISRQRGQRSLVTGDTRQVDFTLAGNYQFSRTVTGRAALNVGENGDNKNRTRTARFVGLSLSASFSF